MNISHGLGRAAASRDRRPPPAAEWPCGEFVKLRGCQEDTRRDGCEKVKPKVLLTRRIPSSVLSRLEAEADVDLYEGRSAMAREELLERVAGKQALICLLTDRIDAEVLDAGRDLEVVANIAVGYNNIDLDACRARGVIATNTPDVLTNACADFTWSLILGVTRRLGEAERQLRKGEWKGWALDHMLGMELRGKRLGLVGLGRIGRAVAERRRPSA